MAAPATRDTETAEIMEMLWLDFMFIVAPASFLLAYHASGIDAGVFQHHTPPWAEPLCLTCVAEFGFDA
jgi:hypothetical protein